jgi:hypothetical protein
VDDDYLGRTQVVRDIEAFGRNPNSRTLKIEPKSTDRGIGFTYDEVVQQLGGILGTWGGSYAYLTIRVKFSLFDVMVGDVVKITWNKVPNPDGTLGVTNKIAFVVGREWEFREASGKLTLMVTDQNIAGYVPAAKISSIDSGSSGTIGPFTVTLDSTYFPGSTTAADHWKAGDKVRVFLYDSTSVANNETATVDSDPVGNVVIFTTDAAWTTAGTWVLGSQVSTAVSAATQQIYAYIANADATLDFSGSSGSPFTLAT